MRTKTPLFLLVAASLVGCPTNTVMHDAATPPTDTNVTLVDTGVPPVDTGSPGMDSAIAATDVPIASVVDGAAADHPADGTRIHVTGSLVALTSRLFISQSTTSMRCLFAIWVGTSAGGDHSGIQVTESFLPAGANTCFTEPAHVIPDTVMIGDSVTTLTGAFKNFCPAMTSCPANTSEELDVSSGALTVGAHVGDPTSTMVSIADVTGMALTNGPRSLALQGALVTLTGTVISVPPSSASTGPGAHNVMSVAATGTTTPTMAIQVSKYPGVGCQRMVLQAMTAGATVGNITGVLQYSFGRWTIQPRRSGDFPSIMCPDGGAAAVDAGM